MWYGPLAMIQRLLQKSFMKFRLNLKWELNLFPGVFLCVTSYGGTLFGNWIHHYQLHFFSLNLPSSTPPHQTGFIIVCKSAVPMWNPTNAFEQPHTTCNQNMEMNRTGFLTMTECVCVRIGYQPAESGTMSPTVAPLNFTLCVARIFSSRQHWDNNRISICMSALDVMEVSFAVPL